MKILVQSDFDGTITEGDVSFMLLDHFANGDWRQLWQEYISGRIPVGTFNTRAFTLVTAGRQTLTDFVLNDGTIKIRPGFDELLAYCMGKGYKFVIVSNGLDFYIKEILKNRGIKGVNVYAARSRFNPLGMQVKYIGPDGRRLEAGFKEAYTGFFQSEGYGVVYIGNGPSDIYPARRARRVFATGDLLTICKEEKIDCTPFDNFEDVVLSLEASPPG